RCVFTSPEVAAVGLTEHAAREQGLAVRIGRAGIDGNDRALTMGRQDGFVKVIAGPRGKLLGGVVVAERAGGVAQELGRAGARGGPPVSKPGGVTQPFRPFWEVLGAGCKEFR